MAFGGGGSAVYTAQLQIDTRQAQAALSAFGNQLRTSMRRVTQETKQASTGATIGLERLTKQLTPAGLGPQQFRAASAGAKATKVSYDHLTASQIASMKANDQMRVAIIGVTRAFADQKKMGQVTSQTLRSMAQDIAMIGRNAKTQSDRNVFKKLTDDLVVYANTMDAALNDVGRNKAIVAQAQQRVDILKSEADQLKLTTAYYKDAAAAMRALAAPARGAKGFTTTQRRGGIMGRLGMTKSTFTKMPGAGGGRGGGDSDLVRGQLMPERTRGQAKALLGLSSAAQGAMIGIAALDGNIVGLGFSLIFLSYGIVSVAVAFAALTAAFVLTERFFKMVITQGAKAGAAMEKFGTQMTSFFKDQARAQANLTKASGFARTFGIDPEAAQKVIFELDKVGMATKVYMDAMANASAATGTDITQVNEQFLAIQKAKASEQKELMEQFAKDYDLASKSYSNSLQLAEAINERFGGAAARNAETQLGMIARIKAAWHDFTTSVGSVLEGFFKPVLTMALAFVEAMIGGFQEAKKAGEATGDLSDRMQDFANTVRMITPYLVRIGWVLGKVVYYGVLILAKIIKVLADTLIRLWNKIKPIIDTLRNLIPKVKEMADKVISWYKANKDLIDGLIIALGLLAALEGILRLAMGAANLFTGALNGIIGALATIGRMLANTYVFKMASAGAEAVFATIKAILDMLNSLGSKIINFGASGFANIMSGLQGIGGLLDDIAKKAKDIKIPGLSGEPGTPGKDGTGGGTPLPKMFIPTLPIAEALAVAIRAAAAHPLVLAAAVAVGAVTAAAIFPKETGIGTKEAIDWMGAILITVLSIVPRMTLRLAGALIDMWAFASAEVAKVLYNLFTGIFDILRDVFMQILSGLRDVIVGLITGDWSRALSGALKIIDAIFIELPTRLFKLFYDTAKEVITETLPKLALFFWEQVKYVFEPIIDLLRDPLGRAWEWFKGWVEQFQTGFTSRALDTMREAWNKTLGAVWQDFKDIFSFTGSDSIYKMIVDMWNGLADLFARMRNPFQQVLDWMDPIIEKAKTVKKFIDAITPGGGGGNNGQASSNAPAAPTWVGASILGANFLWNGTHSKFTIGRSHWSDQPQMRTEVEVLGTQPPSLQGYALGGRVHGRPGQKVPVLAEAGETFLGAPNLARASGRVGGGGNSVNIYVDVHDSVVTNDVVDHLANQIFAKVGRNLSGNRGMTFHRING